MASADAFGEAFTAGDPWANPTGKMACPWGAGNCGDFSLGTTWTGLGESTGVGGDGLWG